MRDEDPAALIGQVLDGDSVAWNRFAELVSGRVEAIARTSRSMGALAASVDERRTIVAAVLERFYRSDFKALRGLADWQSRNPDQTFDDWLAIVTTNLIRDHVRSKLGARQADDGQRAVVNKRLVNTLATMIEPDQDVGVFRPAMTDKQTARELVEYARESLPADQLQALELWMSGSAFDEIARALGAADARTAEKRVRAALARLRRHVEADL